VFLIVLLVAAALLAYNYVHTGRLTLVPSSLSKSEQELRRLEERLDARAGSSRRRAAQPASPAWTRHRTPRPRAGRWSASRLICKVCRSGSNLPTN
jgi:hypothetical protein